MPGEKEINISLFDQLTLIERLEREIERGVKLSSGFTPPQMQHQKQSLTFNKIYSALLNFSANSLLKVSLAT